MNWAAAIGDDANFSTTITNSIATKLATSDFNSTFDPRFNTQLGTKDTDDLSEGTTNLYHTDARRQEVQYQYQEIYLMILQLVLYHSVKEIQTQLLKEQLIYITQMREQLLL